MVSFFQAMMVLVAIAAFCQTVESRVNGLGLDERWKRVIKFGIEFYCLIAAVVVFMMYMDVDEKLVAVTATITVAMIDTVARGVAYAGEHVPVRTAEHVDGAGQGEGEKDKDE